MHHHVSSLETCRTLHSFHSIPGPAEGVALLKFWRRCLGHYDNQRMGRHDHLFTGLHRNPSSSCTQTSTQTHVGARRRAILLPTTARRIRGHRKLSSSASTATTRKHKPVSLSSRPILLLDVCSSIGLIRKPEDVGTKCLSHEAHNPERKASWCFICVADPSCSLCGGRVAAGTTELKRRDRGGTG